MSTATAVKKSSTDLTVKRYELMLIYSTKLNADELKAEKELVRKIIKDMKGTIVSEDDWGRQEFAYPIQKEDEGYYHIFYFSAPVGPKFNHQLNKKLRLDIHALRFLLVHLPDFYKPVLGIPKIEVKTSKDATPDRRSPHPKTRTPRATKAPTAVRPAPAPTSEKAVPPAPKTKQEEEVQTADRLASLDSKLDELLKDN